MVARSSAGCRKIGRTLLWAACVPLWAFAAELNPDDVEYQTPTTKLAPSQYPSFEDDLDLRDIEIAIQRQLERFKEIGGRSHVILGQDRYSVSRVAESLKSFAQLSRRTQECLIRKKNYKERAQCWQVMNQEIRANYFVYQPQLRSGDPRFNEEKPVLLTGYYTPFLEVSQQPSAEFRYPIYARPRDEWVSRLGRFEIDFRSGLRGQSLELFYAKNRFDLYLLQLEGGGRLSFKDERGRQNDVYISYDGSNGRQWRFLAAYMIDKNFISEPTIREQREFLNQHPELEPQIFSYCPAYVFFKPTVHPPMGSDNVPLTDNRSIATDNQLYRFKGLLAYVRSERPREDKGAETVPLNRFVLDQDTGGAIKGKARLDFYFGEGTYAEFAANTLKQRGDLYFLILKPLP